MTTIEKSAPSFDSALRRLYLVRFAFAVVWAVLLLTVGGSSGPALTLLLVVYPLFDAASSLWQLRSGDDVRGAVWVNVVVSVVVAVALGWASTVSIAAALVVWGLWAIGAGVAQLTAAIRRRRTGGQVAQMLSGGISVLAGAGFFGQGLQGADSIAGVAGYATLGGVFFLVSWIRLRAQLRLH